MCGAGVSGRKSDEVVLEPSGSEARRGEAFAYVVHNRGDTRCWVLQDYALEREDPGGWTDVTVEEGFKLLPWTVEPGGRLQQWAEIPRRAKPGTYRITKQILPVGGHEPGTPVACLITVA